VSYGGGTVQVLSVHLESLPIISGRRHYFGSSSFRLHQAELLVDDLSRVSEPIILAGDLNATPLYRSTRPLRGLLSDTWHDGGLGLGFTYPAVLPLTRIDAVLERGLRTLSARVVRIGNSDHRAMYVVLDRPGP